MGNGCHCLRPVRTSQNLPKLTELAKPYYVLSYHITFYHTLSYPLVLSSVSSPIAMLPRRASKAPLRVLCCSTWPRPLWMLPAPVVLHGARSQHVTVQRVAAPVPQCRGLGIATIRPLALSAVMPSAVDSLSAGMGLPLPTAQIWGSALSSTECTSAQHYSIRWPSYQLLQVTSDALRTTMPLSAGSAWEVHPPISTLALVAAGPSSPC